MVVCGVVVSRCARRVVGVCACVLSLLGAHLAKGVAGSCVLGVLWGGQAVSGSSIIGEGTRRWVEAGMVGRSDMLIIGDSIVNHGKQGWTGGIATAASGSIGLAGTGMMGLGGPAIYPGRAGARTLLNTTWVQPSSSLGGGLDRYALGEEVLVSGAESTGGLFVGMGVDGDLLDRSAGYDWQVWAAGVGGEAGGLQATRYARTTERFSRALLSGGEELAVPGSLDGPVLVEFPFGPIEDDESDYHEFNLDGSPDTAVFYQRLIDPEASGITVTGWGYSGHGTRDFVTDLYDNERFDQVGRAGYLSALVHGNSGKLNVVIAEGVNDSGEDEASLTEGVMPGESPEAFIDNVETLIGLMRSDWSYAGFAEEDLSFTLLSPYQNDAEKFGQERWALLAEYVLALRELAGTDPQYSFIDMWGVGPKGVAAVAEGYLHDGIHPSVEGALIYGQVFMDELLEVPSPSTWSCAVMLAMLVAFRRPRGVVRCAGVSGVG